MRLRSWAMLRRAFFVGHLTILAGSLLAAGSHEAFAGPKSLQIAGKVILAPGETPVAGAVVTAVHLDSGTVYTSAPSSGAGRFTLSSVPHGYYEFAVESGETLHAIAGVAVLEPGRDRKLDLRLVPPDPGRAGAPVTIAGLSRPATGEGEIVGLSLGPPFHRTPAGIATIVGGSALLLLLL